MPARRAGRSAGARAQGACWPGGGSIARGAGKVVTRRPPRRLVAVWGAVEALTPRLGRAAVRQGSRHAPQVGWLREGARGVWRVSAERWAASAVGILAFSPAVQDLGKGAAAWLDGRTTPARRWGGWARHRRRQGPPDGGGADVVEALAGEGWPDSARETLTAWSASLARHREPIDSAQDKAWGWPMGRGRVARACPWRIPQRFTGVGMRGSATGFNPLFHRRLAWDNGRFEALFGLALSPNL